MEQHGTARNSTEQHKVNTLRVRADVYAHLCVAVHVHAQATSCHSSAHKYKEHVQQATERKGEKRGTSNEQ